MCKYSLALVLRQIGSISRQRRRCSFRVELFRNRLQRPFHMRLVDPVLELSNKWYDCIEILGKYVLRRSVSILLVRRQVVDAKP